MEESDQIRAIAPALQYLALSPQRKEAYGLRLDTSVTFAMRDADAGFPSFSKSMLAVVDSQIGKVLGYIEMGHPQAISLSDEQIAGLNSVWSHIDDYLNYRVSESQLADLRSTWWQRVAELAANALRTLGQQLDEPSTSAREILDDWSMGDYSQLFPEDYDSCSE